MHVLLVRNVESSQVPTGGYLVVFGVVSKQVTVF